MDEKTAVGANRYERQLPLLRQEGQEALSSSSVLLVGIGGLGSPAATYLSLAGVGRLILVDHDNVSASNLNRQFLHWEKDLSQKKVNSAAEKLAKLNSQTEIEPYDIKLNSRSLGRLPHFDLIVGALDNFATRFLLNELALSEEVPLVHGAVEGWLGQLTTIIPNHTPCLRCIFPEKPPEKKDIPVLGTTAGLVGVMMANEALKLILPDGDPTTEKMFLFDLAANAFDKTELARDPSCPECGGG